MAVEHLTITIMLTLTTAKIYDSKYKHVEKLDVKRPNDFDLRNKQCTRNEQQ